MSEALLNPLREIPSMTELLASPQGAALRERFGDGVMKFELRRLLDDLRESIRAGRERSAPTIDALAGALETRLVRLTSPEGRRAINATGILLHTGLGRAPLCREALDALETGGGYSLLQVGLDSGKRNQRDERIEAMLRELTGCEAALVVNNNAAATMLVLNTLAAGKEVIVSRGQLIEIGGSFRLPDVLARSGCALREVGTTNRTHLRDFEEAICESTGAIIHVHTSNYRVRGFTKMPNIQELCALGRRHEVPVIDDVGSGALVSLDEWGLPPEPLVRDSIAAGADAVTFSGDKLICGPQSGIICGARAHVARIRKNPFARMFRVCKMTIAALESTLLHFINDGFRTAVPLYRLLGASPAELDERACRFAESIQGVKGCSVRITADVAYMGSGSTPDEGIPSKVVQVTAGEEVGELTAEHLARRLRNAVPSVFCRLHENSLVFDMRTLLPDEVESLASVVTRVLSQAQAHAREMAKARAPAGENAEEHAQ